MGPYRGRGAAGQGGRLGGGKRLVRVGFYFSRKNAWKVSKTQYTGEECFKFSYDFEVCAEQTFRFWMLKRFIDAIYASKVKN